MEVKITITDGAAISTPGVEVSGADTVVSSLAVQHAPGSAVTGGVDAGAAPAALAAVGQHGPMPFASEGMQPAASHSPQELSAGAAPTL